MNAADTSFVLAATKTWRPSGMKRAAESVGKGDSRTFSSPAAVGIADWRRARPVGAPGRTFRRTPNQ